MPQNTPPTMGTKSDFQTQTAHSYCYTSTPRYSSSARKDFRHQDHKSLRMFSHILL